MARSAEVGSAAPERVLMDPDLASALFAFVTTFSGRCHLRAVCRSLLACSRAPENWKRIDLGTVCTEWRVIDSDDGTLYTRMGLESLTVALQVPSDMPVGRPVLRVGPHLMELDLTNSLIKLGVLRDAFKACGATLLRLDVTGVCFW